MKYILILVVYSYYGIGTTTAEYDSRKACEAAGKSIEQGDIGYYKSIHWQCTPKDVK